MNSILHTINARHLLEQLEEHWRGKYSVEEGHHRLNDLLLLLRDALKESSNNAKIISETYMQLTAGEELSEQEIQTANRALVKLLEFLGIAVIGLLPGSVITLPALFSLANHFDIELLPETATGKRQ